MKSYLRQSISSLNDNKLNGLLAEVDFRKHLLSLGFGDRVSPGGWIARSEGDGMFATHTVALFPETVLPEKEYFPHSTPPAPTPRLHTIASKFHETGIRAYFCYPLVPVSEAPQSTRWVATQLGLPSDQPYEDFPSHAADGFRHRDHRYNFLRYSTDAERIPVKAIPEEFSKEHLRIAFQSDYLCEISDLDGVLWGETTTYPVEIKEKTVAPEDRRLGPYFGLDVGPFVKLAFYAARRGNLSSLFIVREIDDRATRNLVDWWFITFEQLALFASWVQRSGGTSMQGGQSAVVRIPKSAFRRLDGPALASL